MPLPIGYLHGGKAVSVSVVIPVRNHARTIARAIRSACQQSPLEVVVIDDASTDDTPAIVEQLCGQYASLRLIRNATKSADWQASAAEVYPSLVGTHVICMGADDALTDCVVESVNEYPDAAIVFHDYWVADTDDNITGLVHNGFQEAVTFGPDEMLHRIRTYPYASETGIGSGIRTDLLRWLAARQFWLMGPWSDAIGYAVVAALHGCVFAPKKGAVFTVDPAGYGAQGRDGADAGMYHAAIRRFVDAVDLPHDVKQFICLKRQVPYG